MTEQPAESAQQLPGLDDLRCVTLPAIPTIYGLDDPDEGVTDWVVALPDGRAFIIPCGDEESLVHIDLEQIVDWWAPYEGTDLVLVTTGGAPRRN